MSYTVAKGNQRVDPDDVKVAGKAPEGVVDLRSDTVTRPTAEMRQAMATAEVGDDVYGEDPTVNKLEKRAAEIFEKEAALFVPTGCMGNLISIKIWTHHGNEVVCEERSHVNLYQRRLRVVINLWTDHRLDLFPSKTPVFRVSYTRYSSGIRAHRPLL